MPNRPAIFCPNYGVDFNSRRISYNPKDMQAVRDCFQQQLLEMAPSIEPSTMVKLMSELAATQIQELTFDLNILVSAPSLIRARQIPDVSKGTRHPPVDYTPVHRDTEYAAHFDDSARWPVMSTSTISMDEVLTRRFNIIRRDGTTPNNSGSDLSLPRDRTPPRGYLSADRIVVPEPNGNRDVFAPRIPEGFYTYEELPAITDIRQRAILNARTSIQEGVDAEIFAILDAAERSEGGFAIFESQAIAAFNPRALLNARLSSQAEEDARVFEAMDEASRNEAIHWKEFRFPRKIIEAVIAAKTARPRPPVVRNPEYVQQGSPRSIWTRIREDFWLPSL